MRKTHSDDYWTRKVYEKHRKDQGKTVRKSARKEKPDPWYGVKTRIKEVLKGE